MWWWLIVFFSVMRADVIDTIHREWDYMATGDCIPAHVGLQLMDTSTLGEADREPEFIRTNKQIQKSLRSIVNGNAHSSSSSRTCILVSKEAATKYILQSIITASTVP